MESLQWKEAAVCRKGVGSNTILCCFCRCWKHKRCSGIRGKLEEDCKFKFQTYANQQTDIAQDCSCIELNSQPLEIVEKFCCIGDIIARQCYNKDQEWMD